MTSLRAKVSAVGGCKAFHTMFLHNTTTASVPVMCIFGTCMHVFICIDICGIYVRVFPCFAACSTKAGKTNNLLQIAELSRELELKNSRETHCQKMTDLFHGAKDARCQCALLDSVEASRCCSRWQKKVERLEAALEDCDDVITSLKSDNRKMKAELLEFHQHKVSLYTILSV